MIRQIAQTFLFIILFSSTINSQGWFWQNPQPTGNDLWDMSFLNSKLGYVVGTEIFKTTDGGNNWDKLSRLAEEEFAPFFSVHFSDSLRGYAIGWYGIINTTDGGNNWNEVNIGVNDHFTEDCVINSKTAYAIGLSGTLIKTTDGGMNWFVINQLSLGQNKWLSSIYFIDNDTGYVLGNEEVFHTYPTILMKTTDGGESWVTLNCSIENYWRAIFFADYLNGYIAGDGGIVAKTTDGGLSWYLVSTGNGQTIYSLYFFDADTGFVLGNRVTRTTNGGNTWNYVSSYGSRLNSIDFVSDSLGFTVGNDGRILGTLDEGNIWNELKQSITNSELNSIKFLNPNNGYIVGDEGVIIKSIDGGYNWNLINSGITDDLFEISFGDDITGYAVGRAGTILKTTDGGFNWEQLNSGTTLLLMSVYFIDSDYGFVTGGDGTTGRDGMIMKTTNGGDTWELLNSGTTYLLREILFNDYDTGFAVGGDGVFKTSDGGNSWVNLNVGVGLAFNSIFFTDSQTGYAAAAGSGVIIKSTDSGNNWFQLNTGSNATFRQIHFADQNTGYALGGGILKTTDQGNSWSSLDYNRIQPSLRNVFFLDADTGFVVGKEGAILKTVDGGGVTFIDANEIPVYVASYLLSQNYPNPFNPSTKIKYQIPEISFVTIKVYNVLGNEITTLIKEEKPVGSYEVEFDATGLPSGIYFYQLRAGNYIETKKMVFLK